MSELITVEGLTLDFLDPNQSGKIAITGGIKYSKVKCDGNQAYGTIIFTVTAFEGNVISSGGTGGGAITGSSTKAKANGQSLVLEGDSVTITVTGPVSPFPTESATIYVSDAGQTKAKAV